MFDNIKVWNPGSSLFGSYRKFSSSEAVRALAKDLGATFGIDCNGDIKATSDKRVVFTDVYKEDGSPEKVSVGFWDGKPQFANKSAGFTTAEALYAVVEALGLEFRAEYVVGKADPQIKAVKTTKKAK